MIKFLKLFFITSICITFMNCESDPVEFDNFEPEVSSERISQKPDFYYPCISLRVGKWRVLGSTDYIQYIFTSDGNYIKKVNLVTVESGTYTQTIINYVNNITGEQGSDCTLNTTVNGVDNWYRLDFNAIGVEIQINPQTLGGDSYVLVYEG